MTAPNTELRVIEDYATKVAEARNAPDGLRAGTYFYRNVLGNSIHPKVTDEYRTVGERHYTIGSRDVLSLKSLAKLTRDASVEKPVVIDGAPIELVARVGAGDNMRQLVNMNRIDVDYPHAYGRFVYTEPVRDVVHFSTPRLVALYPDVFPTVHKASVALAKWRVEHPGYSMYVAEDEVEALLEFAAGLNTAPKHVAPKSFDQNLSIIPTVDSLKGCVADKGVILYSSEVVAYGLYLNAEVWKARGGKGARKSINCGTSMKQAAEMFELIGREPKYRMVWCNTDEKTYLYTDEERTFLRDWLQVEGGLGVPSEVWAERAKDVFTNAESEILYGLSRPAISAAKKDGEDVVVDVLRKFKANHVRVKRMTATQGIEPIRVSDLLYTADIAEKVLQEITGRSLEATYPRAISA